MFHTGPANLTHAIRVPACPESIILSTILFDNIMSTPAPGSGFFRFRLVPIVSYAPTFFLGIFFVLAYYVSLLVRVYRILGDGTSYVAGMSMTRDSRTRFLFGKTFWPYFFVLFSRIFPCKKCIFCVCKMIQNRHFWDSSIPVILDPLEHYLGCMDLGVLDVCM